MEFAEGFTELTVCDLVVLDVEGVEDRLVEEAALLVVAASVRLVGLFEEGKAGVDELGAVGEVGVGCVEALLQPAALAGDVAQLLLDLGPRQRAVGGEVDQVLLLRVEFLELCGDLLAQQACGLFLLAEHGIDLVAHVSDERLAEANRGVVALNRVLDECDVDVGCLAQPLLPAAAEEVQVLRALRVDGPLDDHPPLDAVALAASTEERSLEVVVVDATAFLCRHARFEDLLDGVEEVLVDEGLVSPLDFFAVVLDVSEVVAIAQHLRNLVLGDLLGWVSPGGPGAEAAVVELVS
nr:hypothetical protein [Nocardia farcinica]